MAYSFIHSFIHSDHFYSASSSPLLLKGAPDTARILYSNFMPKHHRQLWVKFLPKVPSWWLERESNPWPFGWKALTLPIFHMCPTISGVDVNYEVPERSGKTVEMTFFDDFPKISCFFLREILNDLFWLDTNKCRNAQYKAFRLIRQ